MPDTSINMNMRRVDIGTCIIDIRGEVSAFAEQVLTDAYTKASTSTIRTIILNCTELEYLNSRGIYVLIRLLTHTRRHQQRLLAFGLSEHNRYILEITHLSRFIESVATETQAVAAAQMTQKDDNILIRNRIEKG